tara:strand:- start:80 stop:403 length:324 start_codon:yes stop_codon:yes gene_type:complete
MGVYIMTKLILSINTRNKSFNLLEDVYKDFGVIFHPKTPVIEVENFVKEKLNAKANSEASGKVRQADSERTRLVGKAKETEASTKTSCLENTQHQVSSSDFIKREDK